MAGQAPRIITVMGSGETAPTMVSVHADLLARMGPPPVAAVLLDTPFGFQENAADVAAKATQYFHGSVGHGLGVASFLRADGSTALEYETMLAQVRDAGYVFSGPGSPSYALRQWAQSRLADVLREKVREGGCIVFASAAACTLGRVALPVYEIYKVGEDPHWLAGLDLLAEIGINAAVIPHYNNSEGGTHDTRYCYMGERRLRILEAMLPENTVVLGVDEHTALILDLDAGTATVRGNGAAVIRRRGNEQRLVAGSIVSIDLLRQGGDDRPLRPAVDGMESAALIAVSGTVRADPTALGTARNPFMDGVAECRQNFDAALAGGDVKGALDALLTLERHLWDWSRDTLQSDDMDRARSVTRGLLVRLGALAQAGVRDPRQLVGPFVDAALAQRHAARGQRRFADADAIRDSLRRLGVEIHDRGDGSTDWDLAPGFDADRLPDAPPARADQAPAEQFSVRGSAVPR
jgi:peptidase E